MKVGREWRRGDGSGNGAEGWGLGLVEVGIRGGGVFGLQPLPPYVGIMYVGLLSGHPYHTLLSPTPYFLTLPHSNQPYPTLRLGGWVF